MIAFIALSALLVVASAQYPYQGQQHQGYQQPQQSYQQGPPPQSYQQAPPQQSYQQAPPQQSYQQAPPQQSYRPQPQRVHQPAAVHYVNIGKELAGDYKFGYDTGKGNDGQSFREETRLPDGTVQGAYGYVDETGTQRIVKYTAGKDGFKVEGDGIPKAPAAPAPQPQQQPAYNYGAAPQNYNSGGHY